MKKYINKILLISLIIAFIISCTENQGTDVGKDKLPVATIYQYATTKPVNNPDNDTKLRIVTNNKVDAAYLFMEKTDEKTARIKSIGEDGYKDYVISKGVKLKIGGNASADTTITGILGNNSITVVAVGSSEKTFSEVTFTGLVWDTFGTGTFISEFFGTTKNLKLLKAQGSIERYRILDCYKTGYNIDVIVNSDQTVSFVKQETGYVSAKRGGMINFGPAQGGSVKKDKVLTLVGEFSVPATAYSYGTATETLELP